MSGVLKFFTEKRPSNDGGDIADDGDEPRQASSKLRISETSAALPAPCRWNNVWELRSVPRKPAPSGLNARPPPEAAVEH